MRRRRPCGWWALLVLAAAVGTAGDEDEDEGPLTTCQWFDALQGDFRKLDTSTTPIYTAAWMSLGGETTNPSLESQCQFNPGFKVAFGTDGLPGRPSKFLSGKLDGAEGLQNDPQIQPLLKKFTADVREPSSDGSELFINSIEYDQADLALTNPAWADTKTEPFMQDDASYMGWSFPTVEQDSSQTDGLRTLSFFVVSDAAADQAKGKKRLDHFEIGQADCTSAMPITLFNPENPRFKCLRLSYQPNTCEEVLMAKKLGAVSAPLRFQIGWKDLTEDKNDKCDWSDNTAFDVDIHPNVHLGTDVEDRTWSLLAARPRGASGKESETTAFSVPSLSMFHWAVRTSTSHKLMLTYIDRLPSTGQEEEESFGTGPSDADDAAVAEEAGEAMMSQIREQIRQANMRAAQQAKYASEPPSGAKTKPFTAPTAPAASSDDLEDLERLEAEEGQEQQDAMAAHRRSVAAMSSAGLMDLGRMLYSPPDQPQTVLWMPEEDARCSTDPDAFPQHQLQRKPGWIDMAEAEPDGGLREAASNRTQYDGRQMCLRFKSLRRTVHAPVVYRDEQCKMVKDMLRGAMRRREDSSIERTDYGVYMELAEIGRLARKKAPSAEDDKEGADEAASGSDRKEEVKRLRLAVCQQQAGDNAKELAECEKQAGKANGSDGAGGTVWELLDGRERQRLCRAKFDEVPIDKVDHAHGRRTNVFNVVMKEEFVQGSWCGAATKGQVYVDLDPTSWRWKGDDLGDLSLSFVSMGSRMLFESNRCKHSESGDVHWPVVIAADDVNQQWQCAKIYGRSDANCATAIGLATGKWHRELGRRVRDYEVSLATTYVNTGRSIECIWMDPFMVHLTNLAHPVDETGDSTSVGIEVRETCPIESARAVYVSGANAPSPHQWRWRTSEDGALELAFPVISARDGPFARVWETFRTEAQCPVTAELAKASNFMHEALLDRDLSRQQRMIDQAQTNVKTEAKDKKKYQKVDKKVETLFTAVEEQARVLHEWDAPDTSEDLPPRKKGDALAAVADNDDDMDNDEFKCMKIRPIGREDVSFSKSASNLRSTLMGKLQDMADDPEMGASRKGVYADMVAGITDYADVKGSLQTALEAEEYSSGITGEFGNQYAALATGRRTFFFPHDELPDGHPTIRTGKVVHADGMVGRCVFLSSTTNPYSGLLGKDRVPLIARYSSALSHDADGFVPGWAFKFFRDAPAPTADVLTYHSFVAQPDCDILKYAVSNFPTFASVGKIQGIQQDKAAEVDDKMAGFDNVQRFLLQRGQGLQRSSGCPFAQKTRFPYRLGISQAFMDDDVAIEAMLNYHLKPKQQRKGASQESGTKVERCEDVTENLATECPKSWRSTDWYDGENLWCKVDDAAGAQPTCVADHDRVHPAESESDAGKAAQANSGTEDDEEREDDAACLPHLCPRKAVLNAKFPDQLIFVPHPAARAAYEEDLTSSCKGHRRDNMVRQLSSIPPRTPLFDVYGIEHAKHSIDLTDFDPLPEEHLGTIYVQQSFFSSWRADTALHFKHEMYESDLQSPSHNLKISAADVYTENDEGAIKRANGPEKVAEDSVQAEVAEITKEEAADMEALQSTDTDIKDAKKRQAEAKAAEEAQKTDDVDEDD